MTIDVFTGRNMPWSEDLIKSVSRITGPFTVVPIDRRYDNQLNFKDYSTLFFELAKKFQHPSIVRSVLPIYAMCQFPPKEGCVVFEYPEILLHANDVVWIAQMIWDLSKNVPVVVITHSQVLVNDLGEKVENGTLSREEVTVFCEGVGCHFDEGGVLQEPWPYGFFLP